MRIAPAPTSPQLTRARGLTGDPERRTHIDDGSRSRRAVGVAALDEKRLLGGEPHSEGITAPAPDRDT
jgi:hypothetical protein